MNRETIYRAQTKPAKTLDEKLLILVLACQSGRNGKIGSLTFERLNNLAAITGIKPPRIIELILSLKDREIIVQVDPEAVEPLPALRLEI